MTSVETPGLRTVLVIEDDPGIQFALSTFLEMENYTVLTAENGLEALKVLEEHGAPNLILLDMRMPVKDGWDFAAEYSAKFTDKAPIIVMSAAADIAARANDIHAAGWIEKPLNLDNLLELIKKLGRVIS